MKNTTLYRIQQTFAPCKKMCRRNEDWDIRAIQIQKFMNGLYEEGYSYGTLKLLKSLLNEMFKKAIGNQYMQCNPCDAVVLPKKVQY